MDEAAGQNLRSGISRDDRTVIGTTLVPVFLGDFDISDTHTPMPMIDTSYCKRDDKCKSHNHYTSRPHV